MTEKKDPAALAARPGQKQLEQRDPTKQQLQQPERKWRRVLAALAAGRSLNRFEAARDLHDHCLHSTVAELQGRGITVQRKTERVPGYQGVPIDVNRYWLDTAAQETAQALLEGRGPGNRQKAASGAAFAPEVPL